MRVAAERARLTLLGEDELVEQVAGSDQRRERQHRLGSRLIDPMLGREDAGGALDALPRRDANGNLTVGAIHTPGR